MRANSPPTSNWTSKIRRPLRECAAYKRWWDRTPPSIMAANKSDLEVTTKAVERTAEAIGADIAAREQEEIHRAAQLELPIVMGKPIPVVYIQLDGRGAGPRAGGQTGKRVYANHLGQRRLRPPRSRLDYLRCCD